MSKLFESIRSTLRAGLADEIVVATGHEMGERRAPNFERR
jgi:hypothetical protein